jgi:hypothetical protein
MQVCKRKQNGRTLCTPPSQAFVKKRIALPGRGKRGSVRILLATNKNDLWIFIHGFEKSEKSNVSKAELLALQCLANDLLKLSSQELAIAVKNNVLQEIYHDQET